MATWKKVIVSGSQAHLQGITASNLINNTVPRVVGYDPTTGVFSYFNTSSIAATNTIDGFGVGNRLTLWSDGNTITTSSIYISPEANPRYLIGLTDTGSSPSFVGRLNVSGSNANEGIVVGSRVSSDLNSYATYVFSDGEGPKIGFGSYTTGTTTTPLSASWGQIGAYNQALRFEAFTTGSHPLTGGILFSYSGSNRPDLKISASNGATRVGINTNTPANTLEVNGGITAVTITASNGQLLVANNSLISTYSTNGGSSAANTLTFRDTDNTIVTNQPIGRIAFESADTNTVGQAVRAFIEAVSEDGEPDAFLAFGTALSGSLPQERVRITASGSVGIGTTNPTNTLQVAGTGIATTNFTASGNATIIGNLTVGGTINSTTGGQLLSANNNNRQYSTNGGTTASLNTLTFRDIDTTSDVTQSIGRIAFESFDADTSGSNNSQVVRAFIEAVAADDKPNAFLAFGTAVSGSLAQERMRVDTNGLAVSGGITSTNGFISNTGAVSAYNIFSLTSITSSDGGILINNVAGAAGTINIRTTTTTTTANIFNTNASTINFGGEATAVNIGAAAGTTTVRNNLVVNGTITTSGSILSANNNNRQYSTNGGTTASLNTLTFRDTDTSSDVTQSIGRIAFESFDADTSGSNNSQVVRAFIEAVAADDKPNAFLAFGTAVSGALAQEIMRITNTGSIISGNETVTGTLGVSGATTLTGQLNVNSSNGIATNQASFPLLNSGVQTINFGGNASNITMGSSAGTVTIAGNLIVDGDTTILNTANLLVEDRFIILASGSLALSPQDSGIVVQTTTGSSGNPSGSALFLNGAGLPSDGTSRWGLAQNIPHNATSVAPTDYLVTVSSSNANPTDTSAGAPTYGSASAGFGNMHINTTSGEIWIYV